MLAEMHCHTCEKSVCSRATAADLVKRVYKIGFQTIVLTDHHYLWNESELGEIRRQSGVPDHFVILSGQEFRSSDFGDVLVYGAAETIAAQPLSLQELRQRYPEAAIIWAHPYRDGVIPQEEQLLHPALDGVEIFSSNYTVADAARALADWHKHRFTAIAGTDTHAPSYTGTYPTVFDHPVTSIAGLVEELKAGRCRPYFKEIPRSGATETVVSEVEIGYQGSPHRKVVIIKSYADIELWKKGERSHEIIKQMLNEGFRDGKFRIPKPLDQDRGNLSLMEECAPGVSLYDKIVQADQDEARQYLRLSAEWLATLHRKGLAITPPDEMYRKEPERLDRYVEALRERQHPHTERVAQLRDAIWNAEKSLLDTAGEGLVQGHGDFHPKNIFIAQDSESGEEYIAAIDLDSSCQLPPAFDVGTFISQYQGMFFDQFDILDKAPVEIFLDEYVQQIKGLQPDFTAQVNLYQARTNLSILAYLAKVGMGESERFWSTLVEAEHHMAEVAYHHAPYSPAAGLVE